jgi:hypothetical protein
MSSMIFRSVASKKISLNAIFIALIMKKSRVVDNVVVLCTKISIIKLLLVIVRILVGQDYIEGVKPQRTT